MLRIALEIQSGIRRDVYGQKEIANAGKILRTLRDTFGEETACEWVRRTFTLLQQEEILFCGLCEQGTCKREAKTTAIYGEKWQTTCKKYSAGCPMQYLWEERENMGASQGRESSEQLTRQLSEVVHELSQETAPTTVFMCCVWEAFQSEKFMQQSLSTIAESGEARERTTADAGRSVDETSDCLTPWDVQSRRIHKASGKWPALYGGEGGGHGYAAIPETPKTMLIRCGKEGGGKGPLIQDNKSATLSCANIQTLFDPNVGIVERIKSLEFADVTGPIAIENHPADSRVKLDESGTCQTLTSRMGTGGGNVPMLAVPDTKVYGICSYASNSMKSSNPNSGIYEADTSRTLDQNGGSPACNQGGMAIVKPVCAGFKAEQSADARGIGWQEEIAPTLPSAGATPCICAGFNGYKSVTGSIQYQEESVATLEANMPGNVATYQKVTGPLMANSHPGSYTGQDAHSDMLVTPYAHSSFAQYKEGFGQLRASGGDLGGGSETLIKQHYSVRRLTPLECESLQGFPDYWTDIPGQTEASQQELEFWRDVWLTWDRTQAEDPEEVKPRTDKRLLRWLKNPTSDSAQYKALGNSVAVLCPEYVLEGISEILSTER